MAGIAHTDGSTVDYAERAARSVTVAVLPSIALSQIDAVFRAALGDDKVDIVFRLGKRAACVLLTSAAAVDSACALSGMTLQPKSSAILPPCKLQVVPGVVKPTEEEVSEMSHGKKTNCTKMVKEASAHVIAAAGAAAMDLPKS